MFLTILVTNRHSVEKARRKMKLLILHRQCKRSQYVRTCMHVHVQVLSNVKRGNESTHGKQTSQGTYLERFLVDASCVFPPIARSCVRVEGVSSPFSTQLTSRIVNLRSTLFFQLRFCCRVFTFIDSLGGGGEGGAAGHVIRLSFLETKKSSVPRRLGKVPVHI